MTVAVVVDGAASLPDELVTRYGIEVVPMTIVVDGVARPDTEVDLEALLRDHAFEELTTSGPSPGEFARVLAEVLERADEAVVLTVSSRMSTTYEAALIGARATEASRVRVVDTTTAAGGEGLVALAAARAALEGAGGEAVEAAARAVIERVSLVATLDDLGHLVRSGRVPGLAALAAGMLHVNPIFEFRAGEARALRPAVGHAAAEHRIIGRCLDGRPDTPGARLHAAVLHALAPERARSLRGSLVAAVEDLDVFVAPFGPVMTVHVGPGLVGLAWWWEVPGR